MEQSIQLFGFLILTFMGFIVPIVGMLLSIYQEGISKLTSQYNNEKSQSEQNIQEQIKKLEETDTKEIRKSLDKLESIKKSAAHRLSYLNPTRQITRVFTYLLISFLGINLAIILNNIFLPILLSLICFSYTLFILWKLLGVIIEVKKIIDLDKKDRDSKMIELLSVLVEKQEKAFLKEVYIMINEGAVKGEGVNIILESDRKHDLLIGVRNSEPRVVKNVEIGLIFPSDFIIEKKPAYSIYTDKSGQIVRYAESIIHGNTYLKWEEGLLSITPLKKGDYQIKTFIKAENIESAYRSFKIEVK